MPGLVTYNLCVPVMSYLVLKILNSVIIQLQKRF